MTKASATRDRSTRLHDDSPVAATEMTSAILRRRRRRRDKEQSRRALLRAAFELLAEGRRVTTVEVTRRAGLAQSSFYAHFNDADECSLAAVRDVVRRIEEHAGERFFRFSPTDLK